MSSPPKQDALPIVVEDEVSSSYAAKDELYTLSGDKPFFDVDLAKSYVKPPYHLRFPVHILEFLPRVNVPAVLKHGDKTWDLSFFAQSGKTKPARFSASGWKKFVIDNNLKCDDVCVFEVLESTPKILILKVVILRDTGLPSELQARIDGRGTTLDTAIELN